MTTELVPRKAGTETGAETETETETETKTEVETTLKTQTQTQTKTKTKTKEEEKEKEIAQHYLRDLFINRIGVSDNDLAKVFNLPIEDVQQAHAEARRVQKGSGSPLSWDYVFAFKPSKLLNNDNKSNTIQNEHKILDEKDALSFVQKHASQLILDIQKSLESSNLSTELFRSSDGEYIFLMVGITEACLKTWANDKEIALELDPVNACQYGRVRRFPLALRTHMTEQDDPRKAKLPLSIWEGMYCPYRILIEQSIYQQYDRILGDKEMTPTLFDEKTRLRIIFEIIYTDIGKGGAGIKCGPLIDSSNHPLVACFPLHSEKQWTQVQSKKINWYGVPITGIREYFGEAQAFYSAFLSFYCQCLLWPGLMGALFLIIQLSYGQANFPGFFILALVMLVWGVLFAELWNRQEAKYCLQWGMSNIEVKNNAMPRWQFRGREWKQDLVTGLWSGEDWYGYRWLKTIFVYSNLMGLFLAIVVVFTIWLQLLRERDPDNNNWQLTISILTALFIYISDNMYWYGAYIANEWENHKTQQGFDEAMIVKLFIFKWINYFLALCYLSFVRPFLHGYGFYIRQFSEICSSCKDSDGNPICGTPGLTSYSDDDYVCCFKIGACRRREVQEEINTTVLRDVQTQLITLFVTCVFLRYIVDTLFELIIIRVKSRQSAKKSEPEKQLILFSAPDTTYLMSEVCCQFALTTSFVLASPIIPMISLATCITALRVNGNRMLNNWQRPHVALSQGLGTWNGVLYFYSILSIGINVAYITWRVPFLSLDSIFKWVFFAFTCLGLSIILATIKRCIPDISLDVAQGIARQTLISNVLVLGATVTLDQDEPPKKEDIPENDFAFDPTKNSFILSNLKVIPMKNRIPEETQS